MPRRRIEDNNVWPRRSQTSCSDVNAWLWGAGLTYVEPTKTALNSTHRVITAKWSNAELYSRNLLQFTQIYYGSFFCFCIRLFVDEPVEDEHNKQSKSRDVHTAVRSKSYKRKIIQRESIARNYASIAPWYWHVKHGPSWSCGIQ